jgi:hypothetical protein
LREADPEEEVFVVTIAEFPQAIFHQNRPELGDV